MNLCDLNKNLTIALLYLYTENVFYAVVFSYDKK